MSYITKTEIFLPDFMSNAARNNAHLYLCSQYEKNLLKWENPEIRHQLLHRKYKNSFLEEDFNQEMVRNIYPKIYSLKTDAILRDSNYFVYFEIIEEYDDIYDYSTLDETFWYPIFYIRYYKRHEIGKEYPEYRDLVFVIGEKGYSSFYEMTEDAVYLTDILQKGLYTLSKRYNLTVPKVSISKLWNKTIELSAEFEE